ERTNIDAQQIKMEQAKINPTARRLPERIKSFSSCLCGIPQIPQAIHPVAIGILTAAPHIVNRYYARCSRLVA
ncbi:MAG: hypothetical protein DMG46_25550, partial [Acidobacteria bacterium]